MSGVPVTRCVSAIWKMKLNAKDVYFLKTALPCREAGTIGGSTMEITDAYCGRRQAI